MMMIPRLEKEEERGQRRVPGLSFGNVRSGRIRSEVWGGKRGGNKGHSRSIRKGLTSRRSLAGVLARREQELCGPWSRKM
jgi:hypothetical protein